MIKIYSELVLSDQLTLETFLEILLQGRALPDGFNIEQEAIRLSGSRPIVLKRPRVDMPRWPRVWPPRVRPTRRRVRPNRRSTPRREHAVITRGPLRDSALGPGWQITALVARYRFAAAIERR